MTMFDGSTAAKAKQPIHVPSLIEQYNIKLYNTADNYCDAIDEYLAGNISEQEMWRRARGSK